MLAPLCRSQAGGRFCSVGDTWQCLDIFLSVTTGRGGTYWHLVGGGQRYCKHSTMHRTAPDNKVFWPQMSIWG